MKDGPDIARIAALIGDPARANMLTALMSGKALTATELAAEAAVSAPTVSAHLAKLAGAGLVSVRKQGRHKYFTLASGQVAHVLEALMGLAAGTGQLRTRTGPRDGALRRARVCYNHLAGEMGVQLHDSLRARDLLRADGEMRLTEAGAAFVAAFGIDLSALRARRAPLCRECLDWSARRTHLAGSLGRAFLTRMEGLGWARRDPDSRAILFSPEGTRQFARAFPSAA
ncbi:ArsR/SmtB family transcription factor [Jannaschia pohangensis]|uniref:Transcriptional regulator, ArsR family n=1 Tax=Jannaschia pohangensis TaxID=390807 RepID=A0A1I3I6V6_9RHOB|nr:helix-turn-helix transcriptional regulator [Jannaschia pohangensis]SFI43652.1 transcriptional regulator, ArsR family [Jannaschia pohangensis]